MTEQNVVQSTDVEPTWRVRGLYSQSALFTAPTAEMASAAYHALHPGFEGTVLSVELVEEDQ